MQRGFKRRRLDSSRAPCLPSDGRCRAVCGGVVALAGLPIHRCRLAATTLALLLDLWSGRGGRWAPGPRKNVMCLGGGATQGRPVAVSISGERQARVCHAVLQPGSPAHHQPGGGRDRRRRLRAPVTWYRQTQQSRAWGETACAYRLREAVRRTDSMLTVGYGDDPCATLSRLGLDVAA